MRRLTPLWTAVLTALWMVTDTGRCTATLRAAGQDLARRWAAVRRRPDAGYTTEAVVVTALLVVAALVVLAIIIAKVTEKANGITLGLAR